MFEAVRLNKQSVFGLCYRLEDSLPDSPFASTAHHLLLFAESSDNNGSDLWSPSSDNDDNSTPSTLSDSFNSFNYQMPRF